MDMYGFVTEDVENLEAQRRQARNKVCACVWGIEAQRRQARNKVCVHVCGA